MKNRKLFAIACLLLAFVFGWTGFAQKQETASRQAWEYRMVHSDFGEAELNRLGAEGWELVTVEPPTNKKNQQYVLKRMKEIVRAGG